MARIGEMPLNNAGARLLGGYQSNPVQASPESAASMHFARKRLFPDMGRGYGMANKDSAIRQHGMMSVLSPMQATFTSPSAASMRLHQPSPAPYGVGLANPANIAPGTGYRFFGPPGWQSQANQPKVPQSPSRYQDAYDRLDSRISDLGTRMDGSEDQEQVGNMALQQQRLQGTRDYYARTEQEGDRLYAGMQAKVAAAGGDTGVLRPHELDYWNRRELSKTDPTVFSSTPSAAAAGAIAQGSQLRQAEMARQLPSPASVTPSSSPFAQQPQPQPSSLRQGMLTLQAPMTPQQSPMSVGVPSTSVAPQQPSQQQSTSSPPPRGTEGAYGQTRTTTPRIPSTITIPHGNPAYPANMGPKNSATGMQAIYDDATKAMSPGRQVQPMFDARSYNYQMPTGAYGQTGSFGQQTGTWRNQFGNTIASPSNPRGLGRQQNMPLQPLPPLPDQNTTTRSGAPARMGVNQFSRANRPRGTTF